MSDLKIITPPDILHTNEFSFLLIHPTKIVKEQFQNLISEFNVPFHVYLYEEDNNPEWLLTIFKNVDITILDIDNCPPKVRNLTSFFLSKDKTFWLTKSTDSYYNIISRNQIYDLDYLTNILGGKLEK
jgi:uncharacterized pyridoxamine 5'-phosphate oxidase family protein